MNIVENLAGYLSAALPLLFALVIVLPALGLTNYFLLGRPSGLGAGSRIPRQLMMIGFTVISVIIVILSAPISDNTKAQLISILGAIFTGVIALSSTTLVGNALAGLMLRVIKTIRDGDFIQVGDHFGRVTERGLFHTEIQTEDRELSTFPNMYLVTNPVKVVRSSGTIISSSLSLGYDVSRVKIEELLKKAALDAGLTDPFVHVSHLGDFSVTYRISGFLADVKPLLTIRSNLRKMILDVLHDAGIEIVSPTFMNQRRLTDSKKIIPRESKTLKADRETTVVDKPESIIFDKAEEAETEERLEIKLGETDIEISDLESQQGGADDKEKQNLERKIKRLEKKQELIRQKLASIRVE